MNLRFMTSRQHLVPRVLLAMVCLFRGSLYAQDTLEKPAEAPPKPVDPQSLPVDGTQVRTTPAPADNGQGQSNGLPKLSPEAIAALPARTGNWSVGFDVRQLDVTPNNRRYKQRGLEADINFGYVYVANSWWGTVRGHVPFAPTSQYYDESPPIDYEGYGVSTTFGKTLSASSLRQASGDYGVEVGLEIFQLVGRSFRRQVLPDRSISEAWVIRTGWTAITPAFSATFLKPARPQGNRPEWLMTRIEGYHVSLGVVIPVQKTLDVRWEHDRVGQGDHGTWKGIFGIASLSTWLGI